MHHSRFGAQVTLWGLFPLPGLIGKDRALADTVGGANGILAWVVLASIALHVAGVLFQALIKHGGVLSRMMPDTRR